MLTDLFITAMFDASGVYRDGLLQPHGEAQAHADFLDFGFGDVFGGGLLEDAADAAALLFDEVEFPENAGDDRGADFRNARFHILDGHPRQEDVRVVDADGPKILPRHIFDLDPMDGLAVDLIGKGVQGWFLRAVLAVARGSGETVADASIYLEQAASAPRNIPGQTGRDYFCCDR